MGYADTSSVGKESACNAGDPGLIPGVRKIHWRRDQLPIPVFLGFPCGLAGKESTCNVGDLGSIPGLGRSPGKGKGYPLQYSGLENSMDYIVHGIANFFRASLVSQRVKSLPAMWDTHRFDPSVGKILWRRKWQPTAVFLPRESHGQRSPADYSL